MTTDISYWSQRALRDFKFPVKLFQIHQNNFATPEAQYLEVYKYYNNPADYLKPEILCDNLELVKYLAARADFKPDPLSKGLIVAARTGKLEIVKYLANFAGTDLNSAFWWACFGNQLDTAKYLVSLVETPLHFDLNISLLRAVENGNIEIAKYLISIGATNMKELRATARERGNSEMIKLLSTI